MVTLSNIGSYSGKFIFYVLIVFYVMSENGLSRPFGF